MIPNLSKDMIDVMQILRKALNNEFNLSLKLSQPDIVDQIQLWAGKSQEKETQVQCSNLENLMGMSPFKAKNIKTNAEPVVAKSNKRIYRGQVVEEAIEGMADSQPLVPKTPPKTKRMYRGQVVS